MLRWTARWVRTTFDYNPTFPLSAFLLLAGLKRLASDGFLDFGQAGSTLAGLSILQGYELCLLGVALLVLWPKRIAYETTAIFILFGLARFAAPFVAISFAAEGHPFEAALMGLGVAALSIGKTEAIARRVLPAEPRERLYDGALQLLACVGMPLVTHGLSKGTGDAFSHDTARLLQLGAWWGLAVLLVPLAFRLPDLGRSSPLHVPGPTAVFHGWAARRTGLNLIGMPFLLGSALWLGGNEPVFLQVFPLLLVVFAVAAAVTRAGGVEAPAWLAHAPAGIATALVLLPMDVLVGRAHFVSQGVALLAFLPLAAAAVPLIARGQARSGLRSLAVVAGLAPLVLARSAHDAELYALGVAVLLAAVGFAKRSDRLVSQGAIAAAVLGAHLALQSGGKGGTALPLLTTPSEVVLALGALFATLVALRLRDAKLATTIALTGCFGPVGIEAIRGEPGAQTILVALAASSAAAYLGWRQGRPAIVKSAGASVAVLLARRFGAEIGSGAGLIVLAFGSIGAGTYIALRRERLESERRASVAAALSAAEAHARGTPPPLVASVFEPGDLEAEPSELEPAETPS